MCVWSEIVEEFPVHNSSFVDFLKLTAGITERVVVKNPNAYVFTGKDVVCKTANLSCE